MHARARMITLPSAVASLTSISFLSRKELKHTKLIQNRVYINQYWVKNRVSPMLNLNNKIACADYK